MYRYRQNRCFFFFCYGKTFCRIFIGSFPKLTILDSYSFRIIIFLHKIAPIGQMHIIEVMKDCTRLYDQPFMIFSIIFQEIDSHCLNQSRCIAYRVIFYFPGQVMLISIFSYYRKKAFFFGCNFPRLEIKYQAFIAKCKSQLIKIFFQLLRQFLIIRKCLFTIAGSQLIAVHQAKITFAVDDILKFYILPGFGIDVIGFYPAVLSNDILGRLFIQCQTGNMRISAYCKKYSAAFVGSFAYFPIYCLESFGQLWVFLLILRR